MVLMGLLVLVFCVGAILQKTQPLAVPLVLGLLGLFMVALGIDEGFFAQVEVGANEVRVRKWGSWESFSLEGLEAVDVLRDFIGFGGLIVVMVGKGRASVQINLRQYQNRRELAQAILQGVWSHNKNVLIMPRVERRFGKPPFPQK